MTRGIIRQLAKVTETINDRIAANTNPDSMFSRGLAREGYLGGYYDAIQDVTLALHGVQPNREYWRKLGDKTSCD